MIRGEFRLQLLDIFPGNLEAWPAKPLEFRFPTQALQTGCKPP